MIIYSFFAGLELNLFILIHSERSSNSCCVSRIVFSTSFDVIVATVSSA